MSFSPLRFIHAAEIFLGRPISRVSSTETALAPDVADVIDNATRIAFDRVIDAAIEHNVDFVLLGGNTFVEAEHSLSARIDLLAGFDLLAENGIRVFIALGKVDPPDAWRAISDLPDNVTVFFDHDSEPVAVLREGKVIATVAESIPSVSRPENPVQLLRSEAVRRHPFAILLLPRENSDDIVVADYVALCSGSSRRTISLKSGIVHHPGPTQGFDPQQTGRYGCTLVEVDSDGTIQCSFVPTAAVVWEQHRLNVDSETTDSELSERMQSAISRFGELPHETVRIVQWTVQGHGPIWETLSTRETRRRFVERYCERCADESTGPVVHDFRMLFDATTATASTIAAEDSLAKDFLEAIDRDARFPNESLERCLDEAAFGDPEWSQELRTLIPQLDHEAIFAHARRLGVSWFCSANGKGRTS